MTDEGYTIKTMPGKTIIGANNVPLKAGDVYILVDPQGKELGDYSNPATATARLRRLNRKYFAKGGAWDTYRDGLTPEAVIYIAQVKGEC